MLTKSVVSFLGSIILMISLNLNAAEILSQNKQETLSSIENDIDKVAQSTGLNQSDIAIQWNPTGSGGYIASIQCTNSDKCNKSEVSLTLTKQEMEKLKTSHLQNQLLRSKLKVLLKSRSR